MSTTTRPRAYRDLQGNAWEWDDERHCFVMEATVEATPTTTTKASSPPDRAVPMPPGVSVVVGEFEGKYEP